ncbi:DUF6954 family protein [Peribacillus deserti]|uniref:Uncharacterized protein n=1 Tax=Peribacillus deserti TaxID=673318 RepID=A0A2N5M820_9BACI|nr:hypothetical protein [Peribacillus deserti]PLT30497.1 hypothetical protein CUU66_07500 [Peribacillus deserti]
MSKFISIYYTILYITVTFFGVGRVLFAGGSNEERFHTTLIILFIYIGLIVSHILLVKKTGK